jgi:hypothetical protein
MNFAKGRPRRDARTGCSIILAGATTWQTRLFFFLYSIASAVVDSHRER